jgi:hypothetical protein
MQLKIFWTVALLILSPWAQASTRIEFDIGRSNEQGYLFTHEFKKPKDTYSVAYFVTDPVRGRTLIAGHHLTRSEYKARLKDFSVIATRGERAGKNNCDELHLRMSRFRGKLQRDQVDYCFDNQSLQTKADYREWLIRTHHRIFPQ